MRVTMINPLTVLLLALLFSACGQKSDNDVRLHHYDGKEQIYRQALKRAKTDHASYFAAAKSAGIEGQIKGVRVLGANHECVLFINKSSIIIEEPLPLFCFKNGSLDISQEL